LFGSIVSLENTSLGETKSVDILVIKTEIIL